MTSTTRDGLDTSVRQVLDEWDRIGPTSTEKAPPGEARDTLRAFVHAFSGPRLSMAGVEEHEIGSSGQRVRVYRPEQLDPATPTVVFFHGGGWVIGDLETHDDICRAIAFHGGCVVVAPTYRTAPEHPCPAAIEDCFEALEWVADHAALLRAPSGNLVVAGDSAGGNLAVAAAYLSRLKGFPHVTGQILFYPVTDFELESSTFRTYAEGYFLTTQAMRWFWEDYLSASSVDPHSPTVSVVKSAEDGETPPTLIVTAECDPLRDQAETYAKALAERGVDVRLTREAGMCHGFLSMGARVPRAEHVLHYVGEYVREMARA